jgi:predicted lipoprotein with Yx(FWY)xxD motif
MKATKTADTGYLRAQSRAGRRYRPAVHRGLGGLPLIGAVAVVLGLGLAACGSSSAASPTTSTHAPTSSTATPSSSAKPGGPVVATAVVAGFGRILVTSSGRTLYELSSDTPGHSTCSSACEAAWPPLALNPSEHATAGSGARASCLAGRSGIATEPSGGHQVAYCGHPLYTFSGDSASGQVNGFGIHAFGGTWYPMSASGTPVEHRSSSSGATTTTSHSSGYGY